MRVINSIVSEKVLTKGYKKFCYSLVKILLVILFFPFVYYYSKKYQKLFLRFCFWYQRSGTIKTDDNKLIDFNSFEHYFYDCHIKNLNKYGYPINFTEENSKEFVIKNHNNQDISCLTVINNQPSTKWVIGFHGWTENKYLALRLVSHFYQQGYNILTFDSMGHGKSYGQYSDIGLTSAGDVSDIIKWLKNHYQVNIIGLIGNSMGAATINHYLLNYQVEDKIKWAIADCGFTNLIVQYRYVMQYRFKKPWWLISFQLAKRYQKYSGTNIADFNLLKAVKNGFQVPTLLVHGKNDDFVPFFMSNVLHQKLIKINNHNYDYLFLDGVGHVASLAKAYDQYVTKITEFTNKYENK